ncbi:MAG: hypothetical protein WDN00_09315 [Limisphaerales bacterium]
MFGNPLAGKRQTCMLVGLASDLLDSVNGRMESEPLKILFIGGDGQFARSLAQMPGEVNEFVTVPTMDEATPSFRAIILSARFSLIWRRRTRMDCFRSACCP